MLDFFADTLPSKTAALVEKIQAGHKDLMFLKKFYLSGGTGLSLHLGHRESIDLDFFSEDEFDPVKVQQQLQLLGELQSTELSNGTVNTFIDDVKVQMLHYPYPLIDAFHAWNNISISSVKDIALTKLQTISMRGSKKDFVDLFFILQHFSLVELFSLLDEKYEESNYNKAHILKSLVYFEDAEQQPMPKMLKATEWAEVKSKLTSAVQEFQF